MPAQRAASWTRCSRCGRERLRRHSSSTPSTQGARHHQGPRTAVSECHAAACPQHCSVARAGRLDAGRVVQEQQAWAPLTSDLLVLARTRDGQALAAGPGCSCAGRTNGQINQRSHEADVQAWGRLRGYPNPIMSEPWATLTLGRTDGHVDQRPGEAVVQARERRRPLVGLDARRVQQPLRRFLPRQPLPVRRAQRRRIATLPCGRSGDFRPSRLLGGGLAGVGRSQAHGSAQEPPM